MRKKFLFAAIVLLLVGSPVYISKYPIATAEAAGCPLGYVQGTDANNNITCTDQTGASFTITQSGAPVGATLANGTQQNSSGQVINSGTSCSLFGAGSWFTNCVWIPLMSWLGSWFLTIGAAFLVLSGVLFDWLILHVITQFGDTLNTIGATAAINQGWTIFRDLSNIVIIGMFTFIAIATILGNTEYGYKKLLSRVLIVAVLINFSLLFAKIVIDAGNFTAYQEYQAIQSSQLQSSLQNNGNQFDIASAFLRPMGITSVFNTQGVLKQFGYTTNSGIQAFSLGLVGGLLLIMLAMVLLYGCFLIAARAVTLVILMITASIAFASYLHPTLSESQFGWRGWWKNLVNASLFGPLLMLFLAISLMIVNGANKAVQSAGGTTTGIQNGGIGASVFNALSQPSNSATASGWTVIMLYIFGIGLLFISFRLSSSFASSVGGLSVGQAAWNKFANGALSGAGAGFSGFGRFFGQQTAGRAAYGREQRYGKEAQSKFSQAAQARLNGSDQADKLEKEARRLAQKSALAGRFSGGYKKRVDERAKKVADIVQKVQPSKEMRDAQAQAAEETKRAATAQATEMEKTLKKNQEESAAAAETVKQELEKEFANNPDLKEDHQRRVAEEENKSVDIKKGIASKYAEQVKQITEEINRGGIADARKQELQKQLMDSGEVRKSEMRHEDERLARAQQVAILNTANSDAAKAVMARNEKLKEAAQNLGALTLNEDELKGRKAAVIDAKNLAQSLPGKREVAAAHSETVDSMIDKVSRKQVGFFGDKVGTSDHVSQLARKKFKTNSQNGTIMQAFRQLQEQNKEESGGEQPAK